MFQTYINRMVEINTSWLEIFSKINKRSGTFIPDWRLESMGTEIQVRITSL